MAFAAVPWRATRVLEHDHDVLVVDKPPGIVVHGGDEALGDDVVGRLRAWLEGRGEDGYLGVHQRLDKDASGVLFFTRRRELNAAVARDMEGHAVRRKYLAGVVARGLADQGVLEHQLEHAGGVTRVVKRGGQHAVAKYRVVARSGERALVELSPETGRTHQLRVQLAAVGCPIAGDRLYGGPPALRMMLHARSLELPSLGRSFEAPTPSLLAAWLDGVEPRFDADALADALCLRWSLFAGASTFRLVNADGDGLPGIVIDRYGDFAVLALADEAAQSERAAIAQALLEQGARGVYLKLRERADLRRMDSAELAPPEPIAGEAAPAELVVTEGGLRFEVRLGEGLSTGLFVDQRDNRALVTRLAEGRRVLNLFAYTCSFSVAAASGGASQVVSVDLSQPALARGERAFELNGLDPRRHAFVRADAIEWLRRARKKPERFALVVLDPPSFGTRGKRSTFDVSSDYAAVAADALGLLDPKGKLLAVTNHRKTSQARLRKMLHEAARDAGRRVTQMKDLKSPLDCPEGPLGATTKSVLVSVA